MSATRRQPWTDIGVVAAGCLIAWLVYFGPLLSGLNDVPGDIGDARFNIFVLEHVYRWLGGAEPSLLSPPMFWPYPYTLAFSDTHAGTSWVYALLRSGGLDPYRSFAVWVVLGYFATYAAAYHVARKFGLGPLVAGAFAFAFAFSLPAIHQIGHAQLAWRVAVPYCFWFSLRYAERGAPRDLYAFLTAFSIQTLINVYLGVFALMLCGLLFLGSVLARDGWAPRRWWQGLRLRISRLLRPTRGDWVWGGIAALALAALAVVMGFHAYVAALYGLGRSWDAISPMVARPQSYLMMDTLSYWEPLTRSLADVPVRHEHQIFLGVPLTLLTLVGLVAVIVRWRATGERLRAFAICILAALVVFTFVEGYSLYWFATHLPGVNSIRAVTRYLLVLAFPVAIFAGLFVSSLAGSLLARWLAPAAAVVVLAWMAFDLAMFDRAAFSIAEAEARVERLVSATPPGSDPVAFAVLPDEWWIAQAIDAILATQVMGRPTLKGYSGSFPPGAPYQTFGCQDVQAMLAAYDRWATRRGLPAVAALPTSPVAVSMGPCDIAAARDLPFTRGPSLRRRDATRVRLSDLRVDDGTPRMATVRLTNDTDRTIHALSRNPLRISWRVEPATEWVTRVGIGADLAPGESRDVSWLLPAGPRLEDLTVSFVSEGAFWAHDVGVTPLAGAR